MCYDDYIDTLSPEDQLGEPFEGSRWDNQNRGKEMLAKAAARRAMPTQQPAGPTTEQTVTQVPLGCPQVPDGCSEELKAALSAPGPEGKYIGMAKQQIGAVWQSAMDAELRRRLEDASEAHHRKLAETSALQQQSATEAQDRHQLQLAELEASHHQALTQKEDIYQKELAMVASKLRASELDQSQLVASVQREKQELMRKINALHGSNSMFSNEISSDARRELASSIQNHTPATKAAPQSRVGSVFADCLLGVSNARYKIEAQEAQQTRQSRLLQQTLREHQQANRLLQQQVGEQQSALDKQLQVKQQ